jgi:hypothetical protein
MPSTYDIDRIVREVLAELAKLPSVPTVATSPRAEEKKPAATAPSNRQELAIASRLVTLSEIAGRLAGVRRLLVRPGTVITPAVKEELQKRSIQVSVAEAADATPNSLRLALIAARTRIDLQPFASTLQSGGIAVETLSSKCLIETTDLLVGELKKSGTLAAIVTPYEAEAICLANRQSGVRAVAGRSAAQVAADAAAVGANAIVVNPKKVGAFEIGQILGEFCRGGLRPCPETLKAKLCS